MSRSELYLSITRLAASCLALSVAAVTSLAQDAGLPAPDCNTNGIPDPVDIAEERSLDCDADGVPDECQAVGLGVEIKSMLSLDSRFYEVAVEDFDGDGNPEIVLLGSKLSLFTVDATGRPTERAQLEAFANGGPLQTGDVDRDGRRDILILEASDLPGFSLYRQLESGDFERRDLLGQYDRILSFTLADFDGDAWLDLALNHGDRQIAVHFSDREGGFQSAPLAPSLIENPTWVRAHDFDGDAHLELVVLSPGHNRAVVSSYQPGSGFIQRSEIGLPSQLLTAQFVDLDGDGHDDILTSSRTGGPLWVHLGTGDATFLAPRRLEGFAGSQPRSPHAADLDGDGRVDLAFFEWQPERMLVSRGHGGLQFGNPSVLPMAEPTLASADLLGDGSSELVSIGSLGRASSFLATAAIAPGAVPVPDCNDNGIDDACEIASGEALDTNENGRPDNCERSVQRLRDCNDNGLDDAEEISEDPALDCDGNRILDSCQSVVSQLRLHTPETISLPGPIATYWTANIGGGPAADLIVREEGSGDLRTALDGAASFGASTATIESLESAMVGDLDGDGVDDLFAIETNTARVYWGDGSGGLVVGETIGVGPSSQEARIADFDGDGIQEVGVTSVARIGEGVFDLGTQLQIVDFDDRAARVGPATIILAQTAEQVFAGDVNGDDRADLILTWEIVGDFGNARIDQAAVLLNLGDGVYSEERLIGIELNLAPVGLVDLNGDSMHDLVGFLEGAGVTPLLGRGDGTFALSSATAGGVEDPTLEADIELAADFDGDGDLDLAGPSSRGMSVFLGDGDGRFPETLHFSDGSSSSPTAFLDVDADGRRDLVRIATSGDALAFFPGSSGDTFEGPPASIVLEGADDVAGIHLHAPRTLERELKIFVQGEATLTMHVLDGNLIPRAIASHSVVGGQDLTATVDLDGDDALEVLLRSGPVTEIRQRSASGDWILVDTLPPLERGSHVFDDLDGDGYVDVARLEDGILSVLLQRGDATFRKPLVRALTSDAMAPFSGDFDNDGIVDIGFFGEETSEITVLHGLGGGDFESFGARNARTPVDFPPPRRRQSARVVDLDADGYFDILWLPVSFGTPQSLLGQGDGTFLPVTTAELPDPVTTLDLARWDGDAFPDLVVEFWETGEIAFLAGRGDGTFEEPRLLSRLPEGGTPYLADVDRDGALDLVIASRALSPNSVALEFVLNEGVPFSPDCDGNGILDRCELESGSAADVDRDGRLDRCQEDCDGNAIPDRFELVTGRGSDCNDNGRLDTCEIASGSLEDLDDNDVPDICDPDCDEDGVADGVEIVTGSDVDCDGNGLPDSCEIADDASLDANANGELDRCEADCDEDGIADFLELANELDTDCDGNGLPDSCQIATGGLRVDVDNNGVLDTCQEDCDGDGLPDEFEIAERLEFDRDGNGVIDNCEGGARVPGDCNQDARLDIADAICVLSHLFLGDPDELPCDGGPIGRAGSRRLLDWQGDRALDVSDAVGMLIYLHRGGAPHRLAPSSPGASGCVTVFGCEDHADCGSP